MHKEHHCYKRAVKENPSDCQQPLSTYAAFSQQQSEYYSSGEFSDK
jgi:hypothetical protein